MPLANSSRTNLRYAKEVTFGSVTSGTGRRKIRNTGSSFKYGLSFDRSKEIRSDRQVADHILLGATANGGMNFELVYKEYEEFLAATLQSNFTYIGTNGVTATLTSPTFTANTLTQTGGDTFANLRPGQWIQISGCTGATIGNNRVIQVSLTVAPTATVITFEGSPALTTGAATGTVVVRAGRVENGIIQPSFSIEPEYNDVTQFQTFRGMTLSKASLNFASRAIATGSFDFLGVDAMPLSGTSNLNGTDSVSYPTTYDVLNCTSNVTAILEANAALAAGTYVKSLTLDIDNSLQGQDAIANLGVVGIRANQLKVSGKMMVYFADGTLYSKFVNNTASSVSVQVRDASLNGMVFTLPAIEYTDASLQVGSLDQDVMVEMSFDAKIDTVTGKMIAIDRFGVV